MTAIRSSLSERRADNDDGQQAVGEKYRWQRRRQNERRYRRSGAMEEQDEGRDRRGGGDAWVM